MPRMMDGGFWKGTPQTRWRYYTLLAAAAALFLAGVVLLGIDALVAVDAMASPFSDAVHAWWSLAGFAVGPDAWLGFALVAHGALCLAAAEYRVVLNALTVACLLMAGYFCMINVSAMLVGSGRFDRDVQVLWAHADTRGVCRFQLATGCSGLMALCPTDFPVQPRHAAAHTAAPVQQPAANASTHAPAAARSGHPQALRNLLFLEAPLAGLDAPECRNCSAYNPKGWDWGLDDGDTCLTPIHTQAARVVVPFTGAVALLFCALSGVCLVSAQPLGLAFALTTVMLAAMVYAFSAWQTLFNPAQQDVREWQRGVAIAANFVAMQLATISIAGLHWKPHLPAALKQNITLVLFLVPVIGTASSFALLMPAAEAFFALVREVYCTLLLVVLVRIWDETAETVPVIAVDDASHRAAESVRAAKRRWVNVLCLVKIAAVDLNGFVFESYYPPAALTLLVWAGVVLFSVILYVIHEIFKYLPSLREAGELQFFSIKAIVSFIFFDFAVLKVLHYEGFQSVIVGELYVSVALVGLAIFQLYTWLIAPLHVLPAAAPDAALLADTHSPQGSAGRSSSRSGYGTMEMRIGVPSARKACSACGTDNDPDARFCEECGQNLDAAPAPLPPPAAPPLVCQDCGCTWDSGKFCQECGGALAPPSAAPPAEPEMRCPACGELCPAVGNFCEECGEPLNKRSPMKNRLPSDASRESRASDQGGGGWQEGGATALGELPSVPDESYRPQATQDAPPSYAQSQSGSKRNSAAPSGGGYSGSEVGNDHAYDEDPEADDDGGGHGTYSGGGGGDPEEYGGSVDLVPCSICGRRFAAERLAKHENVCRKTSTKKRRVFNSTRHRTEGTDAAQFAHKVPSASTTEKKESGAWKSKSNAFREAMKQAREVKECMAAGKPLPPPAYTREEDDTRTPCPHCGRKFAPDVADRHIPKCAGTINKPKAPPQRRSVPSGPVGAARGAPQPRPAQKFSRKSR